MNTIAKNLLKIMSLRKMSQTDLAIKSGVKQQSVSDYLSGKSRPGTKNLGKLAHALNVNVAEIDEYFVHDYRRQKILDSELTPPLICAITGHDKCPFGGATPGKQYLAQLIKDLDDQEVDKLVEHIIISKNAGGEEAPGAAGVLLPGRKAG